MRSAINGIVSAFVLAPAALAAPCQQVGSPTIARTNIDSSGGVVLIYRGPSGPIPGPVTLGRWSVYGNNAGGNVTPLAFRVDGPSTYTLVAVGESRVLATGINVYDFGNLIGPDELPAGVNYTFGFTTRQFNPSTPTAVITGNTSAGVVVFDGYNLTSDPWSYAFPPSGTFTLGDVYGTGGTVLDGLGFGGRIYSASFFLNCGCAGDFNGDLVSDFGDVSAFINSYATQDGSADVNFDGTIDLGDVSLFIAAFAAGC